jgi:hypothetical protein
MCPDTWPYLEVYVEQVGPIDFSPTHQARTGAGPCSASRSLHTARNTVAFSASPARRCSKFAITNKAR